MSNVNNPPPTSPTDPVEPMKSATVFGTASANTQDESFFTKKDVAIGLGAAAGVAAATVFAAPIVTAAIVGAGVTTAAWQGMKRLGVKLFKK